MHKVLRYIPGILIELFPTTVRLSDWLTGWLAWPGAWFKANPKNCDNRLWCPTVAADNVACLSPGSALRERLLSAQGTDGDDVLLFFHCSTTRRGSFYYYDKARQQDDDTWVQTSRLLPPDNVLIALQFQFQFQSQSQSYFEFETKSWAPTVWAHFSSVSGYFFLLFFGTSCSWLQTTCWLVGRCFICQMHPTTPRGLGSRY